MKKITLIILILISENSRSQSFFGTDFTAFDSITYNVDENFLDVSFNDWIYVGFNYYNQPDRGYRVLVSKDYGGSWNTLIDFAVPGASGWYPQMTDMLVAGKDSTNLRVFLSLNGNGAGGPQNLGAIAAYDGITGTDIGTSITLGDFMTYGINDIALCSDFKNPQSSSTPYSVAAVYSVSNNSGLDSLCYYFSNDGGLNFSGPYVVDADTSGDYGDVDISYGSYQSPAVGKFGIAFMRGANLGVAFTDAGSPTTFSGYTLIDTAIQYTSGNCVKPAISMQSASYSNSSSDYTTVVMSEVNNLTNATHDIVSFYLNDTQNGGNWNLEVIDSSTNETSSPTIDFDSVNYLFVASYFDTTLNKLPFIFHSLDFQGIWTQSFDEYPDTFDFIQPTPCVKKLNWMDAIACSWKQKADSSSFPGLHQSVKFDYFIWPVGVDEPSRESFAINVFPNPSTGKIHLRSNVSIDGVLLSIVNSVGEIIFTKKTSLQPGYEFTIPNLPKGIYTVQLKKGAEMSARKIIVL